MFMGCAAAVAVKDVLPAAMEQPVVVVPEQFAGIPGVSFIFISGTVRRTVYKRLFHEYIQGVDAPVCGMFFQALAEAFSFAGG